MFKSILKSLRVTQWLKNLLIFAPLVFAKELFNARYILVAVIIAGLFCLLSGAMYIINDIFDQEKDVLHPRKKFRPIASGQLSVTLALIIALILVGTVFISSFMLSSGLFTIFLMYTAIQLLYSWKIRNIVVLDVMIIAIGFVLRIYAGAVPLNIPVSHWLLSSVFLLALFLVFSKRYQEITVLELNAHNHRKSLINYRPAFLNSLILISAAATLMSYVLYTVDPETITKFHTTKLLYTTPFVFFGVFRFLYHLYNKNLPDNPMEIIAKDMYVLFDIVMWAAVVLFILYWH